tara:strand:+ start:11218 stop:13452 length:2235 start_codon:yes stop_codon:yes gene_type:complete
MFARSSKANSRPESISGTWAPTAQAGEMLDEQALDAEVKTQRIAGLYAKAGKAYLTATVIACFLAYLMRDQVESKILALWFGLAIASLVGRSLLLIRYQRARSEDSATDRWGRLFTFGAFASGASWGAAGLLLFPVHSLPHQVILAFVLGGMTAGAAGSMSSHRPAYLAFILPTTLPTAMRFLFEADEIHISMGIMLMIFTGATISIAKTSGHALTMATRLQLENAAFADILRNRSEQAATRFRALLEQTGALVLVAEANSQTIIDGSDNCASVLGISLETLIGKQLADVGLVASLSHRADWNRVVSAAHLQGECSVDGARQGINGESSYLELRVSIREFAGQEYLLVVGNDVSGRKTLEVELEHNRRLAGLGQLAAGVAHEINNPLSYVLENLKFVHDELAENEAIDEDDRIELEGALTDGLFGAAQIQRIVRNLSILARRDQRSDENSDLEVAIESSLQLAENKVRHHARLVREYSDIPNVVGDSGRLTQVILNLVVNAAQAIPLGHSADHTITIRTGCVPDTANRVFVDVIDTGPGIAPEVLSKIFNPFFTTKDVGEGTGLGLSICDSIIRDLGGQLTVKSALGEGTRFRVELLVAGAALFEDGKESHSSTCLEPMRILVVDDEVRVARSLERLLQPNTVVIAVGGDDAIKALESSSSFDIILCDVMMPNVSGLQLYDYVSKNLPGLEERFIFMTGGAFTDEARVFLETVTNPCLLKPIDVEQLNQQLHLAQSRRELPTAA